MPKLKRGAITAFKVKAKARKNKIRSKRTMYA
jgi:hypothetical protein